MARGSKHKDIEVERSEKIKQRIVREPDNRNCSDEAVQASGGDKKEQIKIEHRIDEEALILPHCARLILVERLTCFGLKEFALITGLNCGFYPPNSKYLKVMEEGRAFFKKIVKKRRVNTKILLKLTRGGRSDKKDKFKCFLVWFVHCILLAGDLSKIMDIDSFKIVDNLSYFERYPKGKKSFVLTLD
ncbi:hypothetical protein FXO38_22184 [Capsicum annuum]|nr:hypothetical protein FXO38_22184 [Capsicum annuum]KAF3650976.1 hypothetical protein FXO37_18223 [Capsicum annuum]